LEIPGNESVSMQLPPSSAPPRPTLAPAWHTVVLVAAILAISALNAQRMSGAHAMPLHLRTYAFTIGLELTLLAWVCIGLLLRRTPARSIFGENPINARSIALDFGIAAVFWLGSMTVLATLAVTWTGIEALITHRPLIDAHGMPMPPSPSQQHALETLKQLAPIGAEEISVWALLCITAGFVEEAVFRGYLQQQFMAWTQRWPRWSAAAGVVFSALIFGAAHAYEGARSMFLIGVFGAMFSLLALFRRSLRPGIIAHSAHDLITGLALSFLAAHHMI
jgi:uncharacterized protein